MVNRLKKYFGIENKAAFSNITLRIHDVVLQGKIKMQRAEASKIGLYIVLLIQTFQGALLIAEVLMRTLEKKDLYRLVVCVYLIVCIAIYEKLPRTITDILSNLYFVFKYLEILISLAVHHYVSTQSDLLITTDVPKTGPNLPLSELAYILEIVALFILQMMIFQFDFFLTMTVWVPVFFLIITCLNVLLNFKYTMTGV
jgi:hypothetical protein